MKINDSMESLKLPVVAHWFSISWMVTTIHEKIKIFSIDGDRISFKIGKERTMRERELNDSDLLFICEEVPFKADIDTNRFMGNACINLIGEESVLKDWIKNKNINNLINPTKINICIESNKEFEQNEYKPLYNEEEVLI